MQQKEKAARPNIILIMSDDHSYQTVSAYDHRYIETPNIDRLATHGVVFRNGFVTNSLCAPSRAVILSGKFSHINGLMDNVQTFDSTQETFPKLLHQAGYQTAMIGKWHLKSWPAGMDYWNILPGQGSYYNPDFIEMGKKKKFEGYVTDLITDFGIRWLKNRDKSRPFCLLLYHKATHRNWMPDTTDLDAFTHSTFPLPDNFYDDYQGREGALKQKMEIGSTAMDIVYDNKMADKKDSIRTELGEIYRNHIYARLNDAQKKAWDTHYDPLIKKFINSHYQGKDLAEFKYQRYLQDYLSCVRSLDNNIGRLIDYLNDEGLMKNTLVVYTSDQGMYMGEHGWFDKRFMYEESFRTPLIMHLPDKFSRTGDVDELVQNIDYAPTFLELAGVDVPEDMQGMSLVKLLNNQTVTNWRQALYYHYYEYPSEHEVRPHYGIRTNRYALMHFYGDMDEWELFDLKNDPHEMHNLYNESDYQGVITDLKDQLHQLQVTYKDTAATAYPVIR